jgi:hypothetical protein
MNPVSVVAPNVTTSGGQSSQAQFSQSAAVTLSSQWQDTNSFSVTIDLSQYAKASLARANDNQSAANRILAFVDANRARTSEQRDGANDLWSDGEPSIEQEYQQLTGQTSDNPQAAQDGVVTVTLSEYCAASVSVGSGTGNATTTANVASAQYDSVSLSVASSTGSIAIVQSGQLPTEATAQIGPASPLSITA